MAMNFYASMYGTRKTAPAPAQPQQADAPKEPPKASRRLSGLKLTGSHMHEIELADGTIGTIPTAAYVKLLEDQIREFRKLMAQQADDIRRNKREIQRLSRELQRVRVELDNTVKRQ